MVCPPPTREDMDGIRLLQGKSVRSDTERTCVVVREIGLYLGMIIFSLDASSQLFYTVSDWRQRQCDGISAVNQP